MENDKMKKRLTNIKKLSTTLLLGLLLISAACTIMTSNAKALPSTSSIKNTQTSPENNSTLTGNNMPPPIGGPVTHYSTNEKYLPPSATVISNQSLPMLIPSGLNNGSVNQSVSPMYTTHWYMMDIWSTQSGNNMPQYMDGTITAVANTIGGMQSGNDYVAYLPMNVAYGTTTNFDWFQFGIIFWQGGSCNFQFDWYLDATGNQNNVDVLMPYTPGDSYDFSFTTSGSNTVTFTLTCSQYNPWTDTFTVPGTQLLHYPGGGFSPCSAVEGFTESSLTNVPYVQTYLGYGESTYYYIAGGQTPPSGITTGVWGAGTGYFLWAMTGENDMASLTSQTGGIGYGSVNNPSNLLNAQDGNYATIYGGNPGDGGQIVGQMSALSGGNIYVYGYSSSGYYSNLYVYVSTDDSTWYHTSESFR